MDESSLNLTPIDLACKYGQMFENNQFSDVRLGIRNSTETIAAHRIILAASSELLQVEFSTKPQQAVYTFDIEDIESFKTLIRFCYTGEMFLALYNPLPIIKAAALLKMLNAVSYFFKYVIMANQLNASNCIQYLVASRGIDEEFRDFVIKYAIAHFAEIIESESFVYLSADELSEILRSADLTIDSEEMWFCALTKWYRHDVANRQGAMKEMLPLIRFGDLSPEFIKSTARYILNEVGCQKLLIDALFWQLLTDKSETTPSFSTNSRCGPKNQTQIIAVVQGNGIIETYGYDANLQPNGKSISFPIGENLPLIHVGSLLKSKLILFFGQKKGQQIYEADLTTYSVYKIPSPNREFSRFDAIVIKNKMYMLGYYMDKSFKRSALECYDPDEHKWTDLPVSLPLGEHFEVACLQNQLFVAYKNSLPSVIFIDSFDPTTRQWTKIKSLKLGKPGYSSSFRLLHALPMNDELHIFTIVNTEIKVHIYNVKSKKWEQIPSIQIAACRTQEITFFKNADNYFFIIFPENSTHKYNQDAKQWMDFNKLDVSAIGNKEIIDLVSLNN